MELLSDSGVVSSLDVVELNPFLDVRGRSALLLVDLIGSLFGRQIIERDRSRPERLNGGFAAAGRASEKPLIGTKSDLVSHARCRHPSAVRPLSPLRTSRHLPPGWLD
jgi:hypothetical protein